MFASCAHAITIRYERIIRSDACRCSCGLLLRQNIRAILDRAVEDFRAGRIEQSLAGFDRVALLSPADAPYLWQRGIAQYYAGKFRECRDMFVSHRTVNPDDVENAAWHFLCVARAESPEAARKQILPVGPDAALPMREVYQMFQGAMTQAQVMKAAGIGSDARSSSRGSTSASISKRPAIATPAARRSRLPPKIATRASAATCTMSRACT